MLRIALSVIGLSFAAQTCNGQQLVSDQILPRSIRVVDVKYILEHYQPYQEQLERLEADREKAGAALNELAAQLKASRDELAKIAPDDAQRFRLQRDVQRLARDHREQTIAQESHCRERSDDARKTALKAINEQIASFAKDHEIDLVLQMDLAPELPNPVISGKGLNLIDITPYILDNLNPR